MIAGARKPRVWGWKAMGLVYSCPACPHCVRRCPAQTKTLFTQPFRITRMTQRFLPLLFPAVDQPISRVAGHMLFDCPRLVGNQPPSGVGNAPRPPALNPSAPPSQPSV